MVVVAGWTGGRRGRRLDHRLTFVNSLHLFVSDVKFAFYVFWFAARQGPMLVLPPMKMVITLLVTGPNFACFPT